VRPACCAALQELAGTGRLGEAGPYLFQFAAFSGKHLPNDAGPYTDCVRLPGARYFLADAAVGPVEGRWAPGKVGTCFPRPCGDADVRSVLGALLANATSDRDTYGLFPVVPGVRTNVTRVTSPELDKRAPDGYALAATAATLLVVAVFVAGTVAQEYRTHLDRTELPISSPAAGPDAPLLGEAAPRGGLGTKAVDFLVLFSARTNFRKLTTCADPLESDSLNGMRVVSMVWIIVGHTYLMPSAYPGYANLSDIVGSHGESRRMWMQAIFAAQIAVDSFFFLSGFLLSYLGWKELEKYKGRLPVGAMVFHRYARLTPSLAFVMMYFYKVQAYTGTGPFFPGYQDSILRRCDKSWWSELLYIHNFVPFDSDEVCMGWTWYLGNDMVFFLISPFIMMAFYRSRKLGWGLVAALMGASFAVTLYLALHYDLGIYLFDAAEYKKYTFYSYSKPYTRLPAYLVGFSMGFWYQFRKKAGRPRPSEGFLAALCVLGVCLLLFTLFIPVTDYTVPDKWGPVTNAVYQTFSRPLWGVGLACCTFTFLEGGMAWVNAFLSRRFWIPLARLTYGAYLVHPLIIKHVAGTATAFYHFGWYDVFYRSVGNVVLSFGWSFVVYLLVERPFTTLESNFLKRMKKRRSKREARNGRD